MLNWATDPANAEYLRLYVPGEGWKAYADKLSGIDNKIEFTGSKTRAMSFAVPITIMRGSSLAKKCPRRSSEGWWGEGRQVSPLHIRCWGTRSPASASRAVWP